MTVAEETGRQESGIFWLRIDPALVTWIVVAVFAAACFFYRHQEQWLITYPEAYVVPLSEWLNSLMQWFVDNFRWLFQGISWMLTWPITLFKDLLHWMPWPATISLLAMLALAASGWRLAVFTCLALLYMVMIGYWDESMNTLALVFMAVVLSLSIGFTLGVLVFKSKQADRIIQPILDLMQVVPTFAYLIPILLLFGFGLVVGLIATAIYSCPPMVRNVLLALRRIPRDIVESGQMSGATNRQLLWWVQIPTAMPTIMIGVNQTIMAALSMVIIAAIIGSSADIGWEVLSSMRKALFGQSLLSGIVIALMAMVMDRISRGFAGKQILMNKADALFWKRHRVLIIALVTAVLFIALAEFQPVLRGYPGTWIFYPAEPLNDAVMYVTANYGNATDTIKETFLFYFLLPLRIGLQSAVRPFSWGFELTQPMIVGYAVGIAALSFLFSLLSSWRAGLAVALAGCFLYFGFSGTPWPVFIVIVTVLAWQIGSWKVGLFSLGGLAMMLTTGLWPQTMLSVYLCGAAAVTSFVIGGLLGIWASQNDRVSTFLRPICDTLQTMPLFVFLIPVLMFFQIGEFSAFLAIIAYAVVPSIRYTEHGLRNVPPDVVEAARAMGCSKRHILIYVLLPLALPEIMLGLNQTIMFSLAMLVITALVGSKGLGQSVYIALTDADFGLGMIAGLGMALIAIIADRIIQGWSRQKKMALGYM